MQEERARCDKRMALKPKKVVQCPFPCRFWGEAGWFDLFAWLRVRRIVAGGSYSSFSLRS